MPLKEKKTDEKRNVKRKRKSETVKPYEVLKRNEAWNYGLE